MTDVGSANTFRPTLKPDRDPDRPLPLPWDDYEAAVIEEWRTLLAKDPEEREVQEFLELHPSMIPGGMGEVGPGGHHGSELRAVFRLPHLTGLGRKFFPDFMWVTRSSALITPILIEIEKPSKRWFTKNGRPTSHFTQAHDQLNDWRAWFSVPENQSIFRKTYTFDRRFDFIPMEPQYVLVFGRSSEFAAGGPHSSPQRLLAKRESQRLPDEAFISFDSLRPRMDSGSTLTATMTVHGPRAFALSPVFGTSTDSGEDARVLGALDEAIGRSVMMSAERKAYIAARWKHWEEIQAGIDADRNEKPPRQFGYE